jgi:hypothetical protein
MARKTSRSNAATPTVAFPADKFLGGERSDEQPVSRRAMQPIYANIAGVQRRILKNDATNGVEIAINEYESGTASAAHPMAHQGFQFGIVIDSQQGLHVQQKDLTTQIPTWRRR